ncbi:hypothetical protein BDW02DRAFT_278289 [Decorospora gaudefroyi]|uniref:Uncharacterized protein n=1 Tax=Decorospora gaudefroyi TaxID=184978 RepID=A0A6A5KQ27_9PLEO|nr:hypothetical protein BDW02DRAFT_278289 [Decorospora gaudefroyi]
MPLGMLTSVAVTVVPFIFALLSLSALLISDAQLVKRGREAIGIGKQTKSGRREGRLQKKRKKNGASIAIDHLAPFLSSVSYSRDGTIGAGHLLGVNSFQTSQQTPPRVGEEVPRMRGGASPQDGMQGA